MPSIVQLVGMLAVAILATSVTAAEPAANAMSLRGRRTEAMEYQAVMATVVPQCFIENGWDFQGYDITSVKGSVDQCCGKCYNQRGCEAWTWTNFNGGTCWLKAAGFSPVANPNAKSAIMSIGTPARCQLIQDYDIVAQDVGSVKSANAESCCGICQGFTGCRTFSWSNYQGGTCWLKGTYSGDVVYKAGVRSAFAYPVHEAVTQCSKPNTDTDLVGNDNGNVQNVPLPERCCQICRTSSGCRAYSWTGDNGGTCYLKTRGGEQVAKKGVTSGQVWPNPEEPCRTYGSTDFVGQDIGSAPSASAETCCTQCRSFNGCRAWTWTNYNGGTCWFKSSTIYSNQKEGAVSGVVFVTVQA